MSSSITKFRAMQAAEMADNELLRRQQEALSAACEREDAARKELASRVATKKIILEKYNALFLECERRAGARRQAGLSPDHYDPRD
jgi:hypothetical protein